MELFNILLEKEICEGKTTKLTCQKATQNSQSVDEKKCSPDLGQHHIQLPIEASNRNKIKKT